MRVSIYGRLCFFFFLWVNYPFKARRRQTSEKQHKDWKRDGERLKTEKDWIKGERGNNRQPQESIKPPPRRKHRTSRNDWNRIASASTPQQTKAPIVQCCATNTARGNIGALKKHGVTPLPFPPLYPSPWLPSLSQLWHWQGNAAPLRSSPLQGLQTKKYALCLPVDWDLTHTRLDGRGAVPGSARRGPETLSSISETEGARERRFRQLHCIIIQRLTIRSKEKRQWLRMTWRCLWQTQIPPEDGSLMN